MRITMKMAFVMVNFLSIGFDMTWYLEIDWIWFELSTNIWHSSKQNVMHNNSPVIGNAGVCNCCTNSTQRTHQRKCLTSSRTESVTVIEWIVNKNWRFRHHQKVTKCQIYYKHIWWRTKWFCSAWMNVWLINWLEYFNSANERHYTYDVNTHNTNPLPMIATKKNAM